MPISEGIGPGEIADVSDATTQSLIGALVESAPATDTASSGLNGRLQRVAQRLTSLLTALSDKTQQTKITDGTLDLLLKNGVISLTDISIPVRPIPYEPQTYSTAAVGFVPVASATDIFTIQGSATKTIRINKIKVSGTTTSGSAIKATISAIKRSSANTGGTSSTLTNVPHDSNNAASTAVVKSYTANPTALGTTVGAIRADTTSFQASGISEGVLEWIFKDGAQHLVLRGVSEFLSINLNAASITGGVISISIEWSEV